MLGRGNMICQIIPSNTQGNYSCDPSVYKDKRAVQIVGAKCLAWLTRWMSLLYGNVKQGTETVGFRKGPHLFVAVLVLVYWL